MAAIAYPLAALAEIADCFAFRALWRFGAFVLWLLPGVAALVAFGWLVAVVPKESAARDYAADGGVYLAASLVCVWTVETQRSDAWDVKGAMICLTGAAMILFAPRGV